MSRRQASAHIYEGTESATLATQIKSAVLKVTGPAKELDLLFIPVSQSAGLEHVHSG